MKNGNIIIKNINLLGSKVNELMNNNKILSGQLSYYNKLFNSNKNYLTEYFNIISQIKASSKNSKNNNKNNSINNTQRIKNILVKYNSELKLSYQNNSKNFDNFKDKYNINLKKLKAGTINLIEKKEKLSEDNFLYKNEIMSKENLIKCLQKDLKTFKSNTFESVKYIYLNYAYNFYQNNTPSNNNKNKSAIFEEGEKTIDYLLREEKKKFYFNMKQRINTRQKYGRMNIKKSALNDLVTSFSFINQTEITPSFNNNIFTLLNKKIGGVVKNYEKYFDNEIIDENFFIFLPFEFEINKDEINELMQTDITLPSNDFKKQTKLNINIPNLKNNKNNNKIKNVPKLDFLQIEFNKEKVEFSHSEESSEDENDNNGNNNNFNGKNKINSLEEKIKDVKIKIKNLKKSNKKLKGLINDFIKFQKKIKGKFEIFEKKIKENKEQLDIKDSNISN